MLETIDHGGDGQTPKRAPLILPKPQSKRVRPLVASRIDEIQSIEEHSERTEKYSKRQGAAQDSIVSKKGAGETYYKSVERYSSGSNLGKSISNPP